MPELFLKKKGIMKALAVLICILFDILSCCRINRFLLQKAFLILSLLKGNILLRTQVPVLYRISLDAFRQYNTIRKMHPTFTVENSDRCTLPFTRSAKSGTIRVRQFRRRLSGRGGRQQATVTSQSSFVDRCAPLKFV